MKKYLVTYLTAARSQVGKVNSTFYLYRSMYQCIIVPDIDNGSILAIYLRCQYPGVTTVAVLCRYCVGDVC